MSPASCGFVLILPFAAALAYFLILIVVALIKPEWAQAELARQRPKERSRIGVTRIAALTLGAWVIHQFMSLGKKH